MKSICGYVSRLICDEMAVTFIPRSRSNASAYQIKNYSFHIAAQNINCGYSVEPPRRGGSNEYPQSMFLSRDKKKIMYSPCKPVSLHKSGV